MTVYNFFLFWFRLGVGLGVRGGVCLWVLLCVLFMFYCCVFQSVLLFCYSLYCLDVVLCVDKVLVWMCSVCVFWCPFFCLFFCFCFLGFCCGSLFVYYVMLYLVFLVSLVLFFYGIFGGFMCSSLCLCYIPLFCFCYLVVVDFVSVVVYVFLCLFMCLVLFFYL